jgi:hypothetical protein
MQHVATVSASMRVVGKKSEQITTFTMENSRAIFQMSTKVLLKFAQRQFKAAVEERFEEKVCLGFCRIAELRFS